PRGVPTTVRPRPDLSYAPAASLVPPMSSATTAASAIATRRAGRRPATFGRLATKSEDRGRKPVQVVAAADRADLAGRKEPGDPGQAKSGLYGAHIMVRGTEHVGAATVAGEQQSAGQLAG